MTSSWVNASDAELLDRADQRLVAEARNAGESYDRALIALPRVLYRLRQSDSAHPKATPTDAVRTSGGGRSLAWCWRCSRDVKACEDDPDSCQCAKKGLHCSGEPVSVNDPTGEAAVTHDRARAARNDLQRHLRAIGSHVDALCDLLVAHGDTHAPTEKQRNETAKANDPGCALCARVAGPSGTPQWYNDVHRHTDMDGLLPHPMALCHGHIRRIRTTGKLPNKADTEHYRDTGNWPKIYEPKRTA